MAGEFLSSFAKFFTNLRPAQRQEIERAFADLQNSKEMTSLDESLRQLRRKPDQLLPIPQLNVFEAVNGAYISWQALQDQRINFYEIDVSIFSNFSTFTTIKTFGTDITLEGLKTTKYVRVRGVRRDGTTTPYSEVTIVTADQFEIRAHTDESFYLTLERDTLHTVLGGEGTGLDYIPSSSEGTSMVWGFITMYADPAVAMFGDGRIVASVYIKTIDLNGVTVSDVEYARLTFGEHYNSQNIGPFPVEHPTGGYSLQIRVQAYDLTTKEDGDPRTQNSSKIQWCHLNVLEVGAQ
jgi:hypothetical protein